MKKILLSAAIIAVTGTGLGFAAGADDSKPKKDARKTEQTCCTKDAAEAKSCAKQAEAKSCCKKDGKATSASCGNSSAEKAASSCCSEKKDAEKKECCAAKKENK
ncbi:MAG: hypothetical protein LBF85_07655 [Tannerella sp.]|nr:hypothetical protein [Tannerella sp.]